jgi:hypothetical protein
MPIKAEAKEEEDDYKDNDRIQAGLRELQMEQQKTKKHKQDKNKKKKNKNKRRMI